MRNDTIDLFEHVWGRFIARMDGLTNEEWQWRPLDNADISLEWRLAHIATFLSEERNAIWLGVTGKSTEIVTQKAVSASEAIAQATTAYRAWVDLLRDAVEHNQLAQPIGSVAGAYGQSSRYSFVLHIADELIHHSAEAALLRDFYKNRRSWHSA